MILKVNTSNPGKQEEFRRYLGENLVFIAEDLEEPDADPLSIVRFKASQFENTLIDDTSLEIEGHSVGADVRWLLDQAAQWIGSPAVFVCRLGIRQKDLVLVYEGRVDGKIVRARGKGFGFNPIFQPLGSSKTLAEEMSEKNNARYHAIQEFKACRPTYELEPLETWTGKFQSKPEK